MPAHNGALSIFINRISAFPVLSKEEAYRLIRKAQRIERQNKNRNGKPEISNDPLIVLLLHNQRLVVQIATNIYRRYSPKSFDIFDLIMYGNIGLREGLLRFKTQTSFAPSTYLTFWIRHTIVRNIEDNDKIIRLPVHLRQRFRKLIDLKNRCLSVGEESALEEKSPSQYLCRGQTLNDELAALKILHKPPLSLDTPVKSRSSKDIEGLTFEDLLADPKGVVFTKEIEEYGGTGIEDKRALLRKLAKLAELNQNEKYVLLARFGFLNGEEYKLQEVGEKLNLSRERIRQIQIEALKKMQKVYRRYLGSNSFMQCPE